MCSARCARTKGLSAFSGLQRREETGVAPPLSLRLKADFVWTSLLSSSLKYEDVPRHPSDAAGALAPPDAADSDIESIHALEPLSDSAHAALTQPPRNQLVSGNTTHLRQHEVREAVKVVFQQQLAKGGALMMLKESSNGNHGALDGDESEVFLNGMQALISARRHLDGSSPESLCEALKCKFFLVCRAPFAHAA